LNQDEHLRPASENERPLSQHRQHRVFLSSGFAGQYIHFISSFLMAGSVLIHLFNKVLFQYFESARKLSVNFGIFGEAFKPPMRHPPNINNNIKRKTR